MQLGSFNRATKHYELIRDLTPEEIERHLAFTTFTTEARDRLALFRMLDRNYSEWKAYLNRLLSPAFKEEVDISEELNRLILNYLTFAYSIQMHFCVSYRQRFKNDPAKLSQYSAFIDKLCAASWPFAFILDYRGYVQHVGLGIGRNNRTVNDNSVRIEVGADAKILVSESRQWQHSQLSADKGEIDLIEILKRFHIQMLQSYAAFVAKTFFPELQPASEFYAALTKEVRQGDTIARMIFFCDKPDVQKGAAGELSVNMNFLFVPNDLFAELGIRVTQKP